MKNIPLLFCLVLILVSGVFAQTNQNSDCPTIDVRSDGVPRPNEPSYFTVDVDKKGKDLKVEYLWTVSSGKIVAGQGTQSITVELDKESSITAIVEVKGFPEGCPNTSSENAFGDPRPQSRLFDEYGPLPNGDVESRTQNIFAELGNNPGAQGYIISYGTKNEITRRENQIRYAVSSLNLDASRITLVRGGTNPRGKGIWTRVWIVPPGADNPTP